MTSSIARRLIPKSNLLLNPIFRSPIPKTPLPLKLLNFPINPPPPLPFPTPFQSQRSATVTTLVGHLRHFSITPPQPPPTTPESSSPPPPSSPESQPQHTTKHQEIEGPTVDRDLSPLANETREVTARMMKTMYSLSNALGVMGLVQLGVGGWIAYCGRDSATVLTEATMISAVGFGFPFAMALGIRQSLKGMSFFKKMEEMGRLQILTSTMQVSKCMNVLFVRLRSVVYLCVGGLVAGSVYLVVLR